LKEILFLEKIKKINLRNLFQINAVPRNLRETTKLKTKDSAYAKASADKAKTTPARSQEPDASSFKLKPKKGMKLEFKRG
jgi:hypothetical protein